MKANNFSKKYNGQMQLMGKGGIRQRPNSNSVERNYQKPMKKQQNQMNKQMNNQMRNNNYNYQQQNNYNSYNKKGQKQSRNYYENSKNQNNFNKNKNSVLQRNAKMILNNNNSNINNRQKAKSAKKYVDNNNRLNDIYYQGGKGNYNMGINNLKYNNNNNKQKMNQIYNNQYNNQYNNKQYYNQQYNNQYINQYNNQNKGNVKLKNNNNARTPKVNRILNKSHDYQFIEFQPYTLKDYKELTRNPVVMRPLGANIGTKEWEFKKNKMKKMQVYSNIINKEHKGIVTLKKDSPQDEIEKLTKQKIENSNRFKASEYSKLVRAGKFKDDTNVPNNMFDNYGNQDNDNDLLLRRYEEQLRQETENMNKPKEIPPPVVEEKVEPKNLLDVDELLKQKQDYQHKIKDIRDTLLD